MNTKFTYGFWTIFGFLMVLVYIGMGLYIIFFPDFNAKFGVPPEYSGIKVFFGIFLIIYGIFRFFRLFFKIRNNR